MLSPDQFPDDVREKLELHIGGIGMSVRTANMLEKRGVTTVFDLLMKRREELLGIGNFGTKSMEEVYTALARLGFHRTVHNGDRSGEA